MRDQARGASSILVSRLSVERKPKVGVYFGLFFIISGRYRIMIGMLKIVSITVLGVAVILGGVFYFLNFGKTSVLPLPTVGGASVNKISKPWIEVIIPSVFELQPADNSRLRELQTGDELNAGSVIETDKNSRANIYFLDGSVVRFEPGTKFTLNEASFDPQEEKLIVRLTLSVGRIWSKIIALTTADSLWEVKTANAVATVRGTAFGVDFVQGRSRIFGSEKQIRAAAVDPQTGGVIKGTEKTVSPQKFLEIDSKNIPAIKTNPELIVIKDIPPTVAGEDFFRRNEEADQVIDKKLKELAKTGLQDQDLRKAFRESILKKFEDKIKARRLEKEERVPEKPLETKRKEENGLEVKTPVVDKKLQPEISTGSVEVKPARKAVFLALTSRNDLGRVIEGDVLNFEAILSMDDGSKINVTAIADWKVLGLIGKITKPGVFVAELVPAVAEFGESSGAVVATWKDSVSGESFLGKTAIFKVDAKVPEILNKEG